VKEVRSGFHSLGNASERRRARLALVGIELKLAAHRPLGIRCPVQVSSIETLISIFTEDPGPEAYLYGLPQVPPRSFYTGAYVVGETNIKATHISPAFGSVEVIEELIEAGDLRRLNGSIGNKRRLDSAKAASLSRREGVTSYCNPNFGLTF
jgi:hypothetical protein